MGLAIVYGRVSTEEQAEHGHSLDVQVELCRNRAQEVGLGETVVFVDEGVSGEILERPALSKARALLRSGGVSAFICYDPDRLARKLGLQILLTEEIEKTGVQLIFIKFEKGEGPENNLFYHLRGAIAEYEKAKILERTIAGKRAKAKAGKPPGLLQPYGYRFIPEDDTLQVVPEEAATVRHIFALAAAGVSDAGIARKLLEEGIPGPRQAHWYPNTIHGILNRETYTGIHHAFMYDSTGKSLNRYRKPGEKIREYLRPQEEWVKVPVPAIISPEEWAAGHALDERRKRGRGRRNPEALLRGLCTCGLCGKTVHTTSVGHIRYYVCAGRHVGGKLVRPKQPEKCSLRYKRADALEPLVWNHVKGWIGNPEAIGRESVEASKLAQAQTRKERDETERLLVSLQVERERTLTAYTRRWLTEAQVEQRMKEIGGREARLQSRLRDLENETKDVSPAEAQALAALKDSLGADLEALDHDDRRKLIGLLVQKVVLLPERVVIHATIPETGAVWALAVSQGNRP